MNPLPTPPSSPMEDTLSASTMPPVIGVQVLALIARWMYVSKNGPIDALLARLLPNIQRVPGGRSAGRGQVEQMVPTAECPPPIFRMTPCPNP
jgi:hypothetical protein